MARHNSTDIQCLDKIVQNGTNRDPQIQRAGSEDEIPALDLQDTSTYFPNASFSEVKYNRILLVLHNYILNICTSLESFWHRFSL